MLEYQLKHGDIEENIIRQAVQRGQPIPDRIQNAPFIWPGLELYYIGFLELTSSRSIGMGLGPISWLSVQQYCVLKGLDEEQTEAMHHHIAAMDEVYLKHMRKKMEHG